MKCLWSLVHIYVHAFEPLPLGDSPFGVKYIIIIIIIIIITITIILLFARFISCDHNKGRIKYTYTIATKLL